MIENMHVKVVDSKFTVNTARNIRQNVVIIDRDQTKDLRYCFRKN